MSDANPRSHDADQHDTDDVECSHAVKEWRVELIGRTDTVIYVEVRDGQGGVWSGSLPKIDPVDAG